MDWASVPDLKRVLPSPADLKAVLRTVASSNKRVLTLEDDLFGALLFCAAALNSGADLPLPAEQLVQVARRLAASTEAQISTITTANCKIWLAAVAHFVLQLSLRLSPSKQSRANRQPRSKDAAAQVTHATFIALAQSLGITFEACFLADGAEQEQTTHDGRLVLCVQASAAAAEAAALAGSSSKVEAEPYRAIFDKAMAVTSTPSVKATWCYPAASQSTLECVISNQLDSPFAAMLLALDYRSKGGGELSRSDQAAAICLAVQQRLKSALSGSSSAMNTSIAAFLLRHAAADAISSKLLSIAPPQLLSKAARHSAASLRKCAVTSCQAVLLCTLAPQQADRSARLEPSSNASERPALKLCKPLSAPASTGGSDAPAVSPLRAVHTASQDAGCAKLAQLLCLQLARMVRADRDANVRRHACAAAAAVLHALLAQADLPPGSEQHAPVLLRACTAACFDGSKVVRAEAVKALTAACAASDVNKVRPTLLVSHPCCFLCSASETSADSCRLISSRCDNLSPCAHGCAFIPIQAIAASVVRMQDADTGFDTLQLQVSGHAAAVIVHILFGSAEDTQEERSKQGLALWDALLSSPSVLAASSIAAASACTSSPALLQVCAQCCRALSASMRPCICRPATA